MFVRLIYRAKWFFSLQMSENSNSKIQMMIVVETFQVVVTFRDICRISEYLRQHGFHLLTIAQVQDLHPR